MDIRFIRHTRRDREVLSRIAGRVEREWRDIAGPDTPTAADEAHFAAIVAGGGFYFFDVLVDAATHWDRKAFDKATSYDRMATAGLFVAHALAHPIPAQVRPATLDRALAALRAWLPLNAVESQFLAGLFDSFGADDPDANFAAVYEPLSLRVFELAYGAGAADLPGFAASGPLDGSRQPISWADAWSEGYRLFVPKAGRAAPLVER